MTTGGRILLVDDEPALVKMMAVYLRRLGYEVETSTSTEEAWERVSADTAVYALAVLDATMPGLPMIELALRLLGASPAICVIAASGYPVDMAEMKAAAPDRVEFLHKPFSPEALASLVKRMLGAQEDKTI